MQPWGLGDVRGGGAREFGSCDRRLTAGLKPIRGHEWVNWRNWRCGLCPEPGSERDLDGRVPLMPWCRGG